mgnify:CR=1 FL=1
MKETIGLPDRNYDLPFLHHRVNIPFYAHYLFIYAPEHLLQPLVACGGAHGFVGSRFIPLVSEF